MNETTTVVVYKSLSEFASDEELAQVQVFKGYPGWLLDTAAVFCFISIIIGIPGNFLTILALARYRKVRNATAIFIINLSVADFLFSLLVLPVALSLFLNKSWSTGVVSCQMFPILNYGLTAASVFSIVGITINRYVMVAHPTQYPKLYQTRNLAIMITCIWLGAFGMMMPITFEVWGRFSLDPALGFCTVIPDENGESPKLLIIVMGFFFPTFFIVICYSRIMYLVWKSAKKCKTTNQVKEADSNTNLKTNFVKGFQSTFTKRKRPRRLSTCPTRRDKRLRSMIIAIMVSFFACHLPICISRIVHSEFANGPYGNIFGYITIYFSGCLNPVIYVVMSKEYRKAYKHLITSLKCDYKPLTSLSWLVHRSHTLQGDTAVTDDPRYRHDGCF